MANVLPMPNSDPFAANSFARLPVLTVDTRYAAAFTSPAPSLIAAIAQASAMASVSAQLTLSVTVPISSTFR